MKKNDITYEYRVFTHRPIDVETLEVGRCTSKVIKELKSSDKVDGRFFHTSDTDEWFFCWNGNLQKLNLKGDADVNAALEEVNRLIAEANVAVEEAKKTASEAKDAADAAKDAADNATAAVESIGGKADKGYVDGEIAKVNSTATEAKATADAAVTTANEAKYAVEELSKDVEKKADADTVKTLSALVAELPSKDDIVTTSVLNDYAKSSDLKDYAKSSDLEGVVKTKDLELYATKEFVGNEIKKIEIPTKVSELENNAGYLTKDEADSYYAAIGTTGSGVDKNYVDGELAKKQNIIDDIDDIRTKANSALQSIPKDYITSGDLEGKGYLTAQDISGKQDVITDLETIRTGAADGTTALQSIPTNISDLTNDAGYLTAQDISGKQDVITDLDAIRSGASAGATAVQPGVLNNYYTTDQIDGFLAAINQSIGDATALTNTILNA